MFSVGKQEVTVDFQGGHIVTDSGLLAIAQLVEGLGILDDLAERWPEGLGFAAISAGPGSMTSSRW